MSLVISSGAGIIELHSVSLIRLNRSRHNNNPTRLQAALMSHSVDPTALWSAWGIVCKAQNPVCLGELSTQSNTFNLCIDNTKNV